MKKFELVLNQYTFLDLNYIWYLFKRYYITSCIIVMVISAITFYRYSLQRNIYHLTVHFKMRDDESSSPTSAIASLLGEKTSRVNHNFVLTIKESSNFLNLLADKVRNHPEFYKMNFNPLSAKETFSTRKMLSGCNLDIKCEHKMLRKILSAIFTINEDEMISNWYHLNIKTLDPRTTITLAGLVTESIKEYRIDVIQEHLANQIETTGELISNKLEGMKKVSIEDEMLLKEELKGDIEIIVKSIQDYSEEVTRLVIELEAAEKTYLQAKEDLEKVINTEDEINLEKFNLLKLKLKKLRIDISALELNKTQSPLEANLLKELKLDLATVEKEYEQYDIKFRKIASEQKFSAKKIEEFKMIEEKYIITKNQYKVATEKLTGMGLKKNQLLDRYLKINKDIEKYKPDIEYLKLLKEKELKLKILKSTVVSDLSFDGIEKDPFRYKRASKIKTLFFAIILSLFAVAFYLIVRFLLDKRIYNDEEYNSEFGDFPLIGETPRMTGN